MPEEFEPEEELLEEEEEEEEEEGEAAPQPEGPRTSTQQEAQYLRRLIDGHVPVSIKVRGGEVYQGVIEYYDGRFIRLTREDQHLPNLFIFKKEILYLSEPQAATEP
jgi:sRNA-binding regulator protein Hfq